MFLSSIARALSTSLMLHGLGIEQVDAQPVLSRIHEFAGYECIAQNTGLIEGRDGMLYGWIGHAGQQQRSVLWRMGRDGSGFSILHTFAGLAGDGENPTGLVFGSDSILYGVAGDQRSEGRVFAVGPDGSGYRVLKQFTVAADQTVLPFGLIEAGNGRLYGVTGTGSPLGAVYGINRDGGAFEILARFQRPTSDGQFPRGLLLEGPEGRLYGVTASDRSQFLGTVYRLNLDGSGFETIHQFTGNGLGTQPDSGLVLATDGYLYGQAARGGSGNVGGVFKLRPGGDGYQFLPTGPGSTQWYRSVAESGDGYLYGAHPGGGAQFNGTLFRIRPDGSDLETLHEFAENAEPRTGVRPKQLLHGGDGQLYCITYQRSQTPINSATAYTPILLRIGPVPLPNSSGQQLILVPSSTTAGTDVVFRISLTGDPGHTYALQVADSLPPLWQKAGEGAANEQGVVEFSEIIPAASRARFFRVTAD
ncbi:MAG: hypothetical protein KF791_14575 [Verrucomicrobiae bacterium]|nr:hypothetical protein [Verrucomicrobiae bacterium]